jgi:uncharacterized OB-fold protein
MSDLDTVMIKCENCGYIKSTTSPQGFCNPCEKAYQLGKESK